jgi:chemotaxis protein CheZ
MSASEVLPRQYGALVTALSGALERGDEEAFNRSLDELVDLRERGLYRDLRSLTQNLQSALDRFRLDSRIVDLAEKEVPDARVRLNHVLKLTDEAAHRTMDLVERCGPLADRTAKEAAALGESWFRFRSRVIGIPEFRAMLKRMDEHLAATQRDCEAVRANLAEVVLAQGYQDLTGQIIRGVITLVTELERALAELVRLSGGAVRESPAAAQEPSDSRGHGPAVPGVSHNTVSDQEDVDALLSGLGM